MTTDDIFKQARESVSESLIRNYFDVSGSETIDWKGKPQLKTLCPFRQDQKIGSFLICLTDGMWFDNSAAAMEQSGDFIKLVSLAYSLTLKEAAEKIIKDSNGKLPDVPKKKEKDKPKAVIPIAEKNLKSLNDHVNSDYITKQFGKPVKGWKYRRQHDGLAWLCITRHIKDSDKQDIPYHYCEDGKWHAGCQVDHGRELYNIQKVKPENKLLIVEGNKCADIEVNGYLNITWWGGGNQVGKYNWKVLKDIEEIIIWPDYDIKKNKYGGILSDEDQPGLKAALDIQKKLPQAKILNIYNWCRENEKPDTWDIADAEKDGIVNKDFDLNKFIKEVGIYERLHSGYNGKNGLHNIDFISDSINDYGNICYSDKKIISNPPFTFMGHDDNRHYFLVDRSNIIKSIPFGGFSKGKLMEIAPLSYWSFNFPTKENFDLHEASDWIIGESEMKGFFKKEYIRGAGVWMDDNRIIINSGKALYGESGDKLTELKTKYFYTHSQTEMGTFSGDISTNDQGYKLMNLFLAQGFETQLEAFIALGWTLIAPFAGILKWRPHIWITGPKSCGKSYLLENFIQELLGPFCHIGSGRDSAPGIYRSVKSDPVPILLDEMEPGKNSNKETIRKIEEKLELARNASNDFSGRITLGNVNTGGADSFFIRSPFCFSSIVPYMHGEAIESRILICRMKNMDLVRGKIDQTREFLKTGLMHDPGIFRRKIFRNLRYTLKYIEMLRKIILSETGDMRKADNLAPLFAATFSIVNDGKIPQQEKAVEFVRGMVNQFDKTEIESDEDKLMRSILDYVIRMTAYETFSIAELLLAVATVTSNENIDEEKEGVLKRHGIKIHEPEAGGKYLAIATAHTQIQTILSETMYSGQYVQVLKRHSAYEKTMVVKFADQTKNAVLLDWDKVYTKYFTEPSVDLDEFPF